MEKLYAGKTEDDRQEVIMAYYLGGQRLLSYLTGKKTKEELIGDFEKERAKRDGLMQKYLVKHGQGSISQEAIDATVGAGIEPEKLLEERIRVLGQIGFAANMNQEYLKTADRSQFSFEYLGNGEGAFLKEQEICAIVNHQAFPETRTLSAYKPAFQTGVLVREKLEGRNLIKLPGYD